MKSLILFILFAILSFQPLWSQSYHPFPDSNATWCDGTWFVWGSPPYDTGYTSYKTNGYALINDTLYTKIDNQYFNDYCYLREENKKVYCRLSSSTSEFMLYNFDLEVGDTILLPQLCGEYFSEGYVMEIDSILIGSEYHKRFHIESWEWLPFSFIEGVGSEQGLMYCNLSWVDWDGNLKCFSIDDTTYSLNGSGDKSIGNCWLYINIQEKQPEVIFIHPNPVQDIVFISGNQNYFLELYNVVGQIKIKSYGSSLNLENLPEGTYILNIYSQDKNLIKQAKFVRLNAR